MVGGITACPSRGLGPARPYGRGRTGSRIFRGTRCGRRFTALTAAPFSGHRFPPDSIGLAGRWCGASRAVDDQGQVVDVHGNERRAAEDAASFFRHALRRTGSIPTVATADRAAASPPALAAVAPDAAHRTDTLVQRRVELDHGRLKRRLAPRRGLTTLAGAPTRCRGHALVRNPGGGHYRLGLVAGGSGVPMAPLAARAWDELTGEVLAG